MNGITSPIAINEMDEYQENNESNFTDYKACNDLNGNIHHKYVYNDNINNIRRSSHLSLSDLVNNFDSFISDCFNCNEKLDSLSPISDKFNSCNSSMDRNKLWLSLNGSIHNTITMEWHSFDSTSGLKNPTNLSSEEDILNDNYDVPEDEDSINEIDHHSLFSSSNSSIFEPVKIADDVIEEIDKIMGLSNEDFNSGGLASDFEVSEFLDDNEENIEVGRNILSRPEDLEKMSSKQLNSILDELVDCIRVFSCFLDKELSTREGLKQEREQQRLFMTLVHDIERQRRRQSLEIKPTMTTLCSLDQYFSDLLRPKRSISLSSVLSDQLMDDCDQDKSIFTINRICFSSDRINKTTEVSIPVHVRMIKDRGILETLNQMLQAIYLYPLQFNQLLTDYILNVYVSASDASLDMSLDIL